MDKFFNYLSPRIFYFLFGFNKIPFYLHYLLAGLIFYKPLERILGNKTVRLLIIFIPIFLVFVKLWRNDFFFQSDDFAHFRIVDDYSFWQILSKTMTQGYWDFHHIFMGIWVFKVIFTFFGTNFMAYFLTTFAFHLLNIFLFYLILNKLKPKGWFHILVLFLFSTFYILWISGVYELVYTTFTLLSLYFWLNFLLAGKRKYWALSFVSFVLALFSYEKAALLPMILFLFSVFFNSHISKINLRKISLRLIPFALVSAIHFLAYGKDFFIFFRLPDTGYNAEPSAAVFLRNLLTYLTQILPSVSHSVWGLLILVATVILFDFWKKKLIVIPLFLSYLITLSPALFLRSKISPYYTYIPAVFLFTIFSLVFREVYYFLTPFLKRRKFLLKAFNIYFVLFIIFGVFRMDRFFLDTFFLIQFPRASADRLALNSLTTKVNKLFSEGKVSDGKEIKLEEYEVTEGMRYFFGTGALHLFLDYKEAKNFSFQYDATKSALIVKERSYEKVTY